MIDFRRAKILVNFLAFTPAFSDANSFVGLTAASPVDRKCAGDDAQEPTKVAEVVHRSGAIEGGVVRNFISVADGLGCGLGTDGETCKREREQANCQSRDGNHSEHSDHSPKILPSSFDCQPGGDENDAYDESHPP